jgi:hypothetical protein
MSHVFLLPLNRRAANACIYAAARWTAHGIRQIERSDFVLAS